jgi:uncharacterized membrane protein YidH (DUF202 family)
VSDPGLAGERTVLAWRRTGLSFFVLGLAIMRGIRTREGVPGRPLIGLVVLALGAVLVLISAYQARVRSRSLGTARPSARLGDLAPMALAGAFVGVAALLVGVLA